MMYTIPTNKLEKLEKIITRYQKKGANIIFRLGDEVVCDGTLTLNVNTIHQHTSETLPIKVKCREVFVDGCYKINDWAFIGTIEFKELGNIIRLADSSFENKIPERYYHTDTICEHCGTKRHRKDTYLIYNEKTNEFKQVGSTCLLDYTMGMDADECADIMSCLNKVVEYSDCHFDGGFGDGYNSVGYGFDPKDAKGYAITLVRRFGFRKSEDKDSTSNQLLKVLFPSMRDDLDNELLSNIAPDYDTIKDIDAYAEKYINDYNNMYMRNASISWLSKCVEFRDFGLICSFVNVYLKEVARIRENMLKSQSKHVGNIGDRITIKVVSSRVLYTKYTHYTYYGEAVYANELIDDQGNVYIWTTSDLVEMYLNGGCVWSDEAGNTHRYFAEDGSITLKATVKEHSEFKGIKQTIITRGKVLCQ